MLLPQRKPVQGPQAASFDPAQTAAQMRGARAQNRGHINPARQRKIGPDRPFGRAQPQGFTRLQDMAFPRRKPPVPDQNIAIGTGHGETDALIAAQAAPRPGEFQRGGHRRIGAQRIGQRHGVGVDRARRRHAKLAQA